jgi:hypothetical protein
MGQSRYADGVGGAGLLPVPRAEAESVVAKVGSMIEQLDAVVIARSSGREVTLVDWEAPNRALWDGDFVLAQLDLSASIDNLQSFRSSVDGIVDEIEQHNERVVARLVTGGGGPW